MPYGPPVDKTCEHCGNVFKVPNHRKDKARFCSHSCQNKWQTTAPRYEWTCESCGKEFIKRDDHGRPRRFCSRQCFCAGAFKPEQRICAFCDREFLAKKVTSQYCSIDCSKRKRLNVAVLTCINCNRPFYRSPAHYHETCCSWKCRNNFYKEKQAPAWEGGITIAPNGDKMVYFKRPGYKGKYIAEHRLIASKAIGRVLSRHEVVIHIYEREDNSPDNLYICSYSEFGQFKAGSIPWPTKSNLSIYADRGTEVITTIMETGEVT